MPKDRFAEAVSVAERADVVVMCMGLDASIEGEEGDVSNEYASGDKKHLNLPGVQQQLIEEVYKTGKPIILILLAGSALSVTWSDEHVPAIVQAWYPGQEGGAAIASLLFGNFSPSGKLPVTFYRTTEELPDFSDYSMKNRTYRYMENEALYSFGYGLSYTKFEYSNLSMDKSVIQSGDSVKLNAVVKNIGSFEADETVQLYLKDVEASVDVPKWSLKGIKKLHLKSGEGKEVSFELTSRQMALIDNEGRCILEPGSFEVFLGGSQPDARSLKLTNTDILKSIFTVTGEPIELEY